MKQFLLSLLFPPKCSGCGELLPFQGFSKAPPILCSSCQSLWDEQTLAECEFCGERVGECRCLTEVLQKTRCKGFQKLVYYRHGVEDAVQNRMIYLLKKYPNQRVVQQFASLLLSGIEKDCKANHIEFQNIIFTYLPRGRKAILEAGHDQAKDLAVALSEQTGIPVQKLIIRKRTNSKEQKKLSAQERRKNAKSAYKIASKLHLKGKTVFLVDDIVTTGESMSAAIALLSKAGAENVFSVAIASDDVNQTKRVSQPTFCVK